MGHHLQHPFISLLKGAESEYAAWANTSFHHLEKLDRRFLQAHSRRERIAGRTAPADGLAGEFFNVDDRFHARTLAEDGATAKARF
jgi:hypothetical protein